MAVDGIGPKNTISPAATPASVGISKEKFSALTDGTVSQSHQTLGKALWRFGAKAAPSGGKEAAVSIGQAIASVAKSLAKGELDDAKAVAKAIASVPKKVAQEFDKISERIGNVLDQAKVEIYKATLSGGSWR
jgi:hypothetical protein